MPEKTAAIRFLTVQNGSGVGGSASLLRRGVGFKTGFSRGLFRFMLSFVDRVVNKARNFRAAAEWDIEQHIRLSPRERQAIARQLRQRVYGRKVKDVRECRQNK